MKIVMPYFGQLSVNRYKIGKAGRPTNKTRPEVKMWMAVLADIVRAQNQTEKLQVPVTIQLRGKFKDQRIPDLNNLHKVTSDAIQAGLDINDRDFRFEDLGYETGFREPVLEISIVGS